MSGHPTGHPVQPGRPPVSRRRVAIILSAIAGLVVVIALTATIAALTAPDDDDAAAPPASGPAITDQQATDIATAVTRSMFEVSPATADKQIAAFKANTCGAFAKDALPNLITFTDEFKSEDRSSTIKFQSVAVVPRVPAAPAAEVIVASTWQESDVVNKTRVVYNVIVQNGKTCVDKAQFL